MEGGGEDRGASLSDRQTLNWGLGMLGYLQSKLPVSSSVSPKTNKQPSSYSLFKKGKLL